MTSAVVVLEYISARRVQNNADVTRKKEIKKKRALQYRKDMNRTIQVRNKERAKKEREGDSNPQYII